MTPAEYQVAHPTEHAALVASTTATERGRVNAWLKFNHVDPVAVATAIEGGTTIMENQAVMADLIVKMNDPKRAAATPVVEATVTEKDGGDTPEGEAVKTEEDKTASFVGEILNPAKPTE